MATDAAEQASGDDNYVVKLVEGSLGEASLAAGALGAASPAEESADAEELHKLAGVELHTLAEQHDRKRLHLHSIEKYIHKYTVSNRITSYFFLPGYIVLEEVAFEEYHSFGSSPIQL